MANMHFKADLLPSTDLGYSLGSSDERWKIYGIMEGGLEIKGHIAGDSGTTGHGLYSGGGYHNAYNNIILHGDATTGTSGIAFVSDKGTTTINQPSDRAFIQWHAMGVTTYTAEGTAPTLATTGEANVLMIGVGNDATDQVRIQTPGRTGLLHQVAAAAYVIPDTNNTTGTVGSGTQPVWVDGGVIKNTTYTLGKSVPSDAVFTDTNKYHKTGSWSGLTYTTTAVNNADELKFTIPSATTSVAGAIKIGMTAGTAAEGNHTHSLSLASDTGTSTVTLTAGDKFKLTAGGNEVIFTMPSAYSLPVATNDTLGGVKPWYSHTKASTGPTTGSNATAVTVNAITSTANKYYAIESDSNGRLFVNVPWSNTWTQLSTTAAGYVGTKLPGNTTTFLRGDGTWNAPAYPVTSVATKTGAVTLGTLTIGSKTYNGSANTTIEIADLGLASTTTFLGITSTDLSDGSTASPVNIVVGPTTGNVTPTNGSVVMEQDTGEEYIWTGNKWNLMGLASSWALANHIHGNILNNGTITSDTTIGNGQHLVVTDSNNKVSRSSLSFDTTKTTEYLTHAGTWATPPNDNTTYTFANGTNGFTVTPSGGTAQTVTVTPSIANNVTGSGSSGYLAKFNGTNTITSGPALGSSTTTFLNNAGSWATPTGDHKVKQNAAIASSGAYPIILATSTATTEQIESVNKTSTLTYNPSTQRLHTPILEVTSSSYGAVLPESGTEGQLFFQTSDIDQTPDNRYVKKAGDTMTGLLNFQGALGRCIAHYKTDITKGTAPSANSYSGIWFCDSTLNDGHSGGRLSGLEHCTGDHYNQIYIRAYKPAAESSDNVQIYVKYNADGSTEAGSTAPFWGAVWNDYAECRETKEDIEPGRCIRELGDDSLELTTERLQRGCEIVSDTFGFAIGKTEKAQTPTAASGRVLAYLYEDRELAKEKIGWPVCSGPNGTVSIMTEEEEQKYPSRIIGTISAVPDYEIWHGGNEGTEEIHVNGRIWIRVR